MQENENNTIDENTENPFVEEEKKEEEQEEASQENDELQVKFDELNNQYVRLAADFDNYRKRQAQEREALLNYGAEDTLKKLLPVLDTFERASKALDKMEDCEKLKESFCAVGKQLNDALEKAGLEKIEAQYKEFDPNLHEAIMQTPTSEKPENTIVQEMQTGYKFKDRVLRATLVNVATGE